MKTLISIPFFRIMIPFVLGILIGIEFEFAFISWIYLGALLIAITALSYAPLKTKTLKISLLFLIDVFLFIYGLNLVHLNNTAKQVTYYGNVINTDSIIPYLALIEDLPLEKQKFIKCNLRILEIKSKDGFKSVNGHIIAYFKKSALNTRLRAGQTLFIKCKFAEIEAPKNPLEFDYKSYLYNKQVYHTAFIDSSAFEILNDDRRLNSIWQLGLDCKAFILASLKKSALSENAYSICAALLTGYDDEIDKSVMEAFSHSGTLHVLSVSGLHTGLIYLVLNFLFDLIDKKKKYKFFKFIFITLSLWFFALITGFSAPVLRAVIMFNLLGIGKIYFRNDGLNQINILLVSAFVLLSYNPFFIRDVGFLLSYFALFGLIYFQPKFSQLLQIQNPVANYLWQSTTGSFAATIGTLPITLFCFKQFPLWFFICNVVVVPTTFILLILAAFVVCKINLAAILINYLVAGLISFINIFNSNDFGFIDNIDFSFSDAVFLTFFLILLSVTLQYRSYKHLLISLILLIIWQLIGIFSSFHLKTQNLFTVYQLKHKSVFSIKNKTETTLSTFDSLNFNYHIKPHLISFNHSKISVSDFNFVKKGNTSVLLLSKSGYFPDVSFADITTLVMTNNFKINESELNNFKNLETIIVDGSNNNYTLKKTEELSRKFGFNFYSTKIEGAYLLALK